MRLIVLGSAAGGGLPQWNCDCANCSAARRGRLAQRTQCSLAVSADGERWALLNASPDLRAQINATAALAPGPGRRSPVAAVVLTSADIDCIAGLLTLREGHSFELFAAAPVLELIAHDRVFRCLPPERVPRRRIRPGEAFEVAGLRILPIAAPGKPPFYLHAVAEPRPDDVLALEVAAGGGKLVFAPGCAAVTGELARCIAGADVALLDGAFWADEELAAAGYGGRTARAMGHAPLADGVEGLAALAAAGRGRRLLIHVNNTNPALDPASPQRRAIAEAGWELAEDGMELRL